MRYASVYQTKDKIIFCSRAQTVDGVGLSIPPYVHLSRDAKADEVAAALHKVIEAYQTGVARPKQNEWGDIAKKHLTGLGMQSISALHDRAFFCSVAEEGDEFKFSPTENAGSKAGYKFLPDTFLVIPRVSSSELIMETLMEALNLSEQLS